MALVVAPLTTAVMNAAPDALAGAASGVNNAASRLAGLFAVALVGAVAAVVFAAAAGLPEARVRRASRPPATRAFPRSPPPSTAPIAAGMAAAAALAALAALAGWATLGPAPSDFSRKALLTACRGFANLCEC